ncbi:uncharacterized protein LOC133879226 [Alnus glutinosa]|uniref:uncharacterized protein LOC133879226 n=1 Tax=Alnus glutinosa TaxID=3517 RepID=UPI002D76B416|nr:uncharacterized protein LOC133879226 [Alnus glutinosa]
MQRGDVVWARVVFPHTWWPGVVLHIHSLGVLVSFFDLQPPRYFLSSELRFFDHTFRSPMICNNSDEMFGRALEVFGRRTLRSLTCPCQRTNRSDPSDLRGTTSFQAVGVLGFVLRMGVLPWVEETEFVEAVRAVAQVQAFRGYRSAKQSQRRGSEKKNSVYHESDILELEDEFQLFFEEGEKNLAVGVTNITNLEIPVLKEFFNEHQLCSMSQTRIKQMKARSVNEILVNLHCLALDPFYLVGKRLNTVKQNILRFRSLSFQNITDICLKKCLQPKGIEAQLSHPGNIESELSMKVDRKQSCGEIFGPSVSYTDNPVNCLGRKRKLDEPSVSCISFKLHKTIPTTAYLQINKTGCKENSSDSFISVPALSDPSHHGHIVEIGKLQESEERVDILNDTRACIPCVMRQETGRSESDLSVGKIKMLSSDGDGATSGGSNKEASISVTSRDSFKENKELYQPVTSDSSFELRRGQQCEALVASTSLHMKFPRDFKLPSKEELVKEFSPFGTVDSLKTKISSYTGAAQVVFLHPTDALAASQYAKENRVLFGEANIRFWLDPLEHRRRGTQSSVPSPLFSEKAVNLKSCQSVSSDTSFKLQRCKQLEALANVAASTSLHMKFPNDFKLPSKEELVQKFSPFGTVDSRRTKISSYTGAAQVVFVHPTDAMAACQYAKKERVLFGEANIRFWLDPLEHMRRGTNFSVPSAESLTWKPKPVSPKSCQPACSNLSFKSQRVEKLEALATIAASSTSLCMKFPKDFKLPSKLDLVKIFSPFGTVDSQRTKAFSNKGAVRVVFLRPLDAVAAYKYATKKKFLFGGANIQFWVEQLEHRRRGTIVSVPSPVLTGEPVNLKSCLKKPHPLEYRDKKKPYKVRFVIET